VVFIVVQNLVAIGVLNAELTRATSQHVITRCSVEARSINGDRLGLCEPLIFDPHKFDLL